MVELINGDNSVDEKRTKRPPNIVPISIIEIRPSCDEPMQCCEEIKIEVMSSSKCRNIP